MHATSIVVSVGPDAGSVNASYSALFAADEEPRSGQVSVVVPVDQTVDQARLAIRQAVVDYINAQRGSTVITVDEVILL